MTSAEQLDTINLSDRKGCSQTCSLSKRELPPLLPVAPFCNAGRVAEETPSQGVSADQTQTYIGGGAQDTAS